MRNISSFDMAAIGMHGTLAAAGIPELAYLAYFIACVERRNDKDGPQIFSWFNVTLFCLGASLAAMHAFTAVSIYEQPLRFDAAVAVTLGNLSYCCCELMYVWYTWLRSKAILKLKGGIRYRVSAAIVVISPGIYSIQLVILCLHLYWANESQKPATLVAIFVSSTICGLAIILFDCIMLLAYISFLRENQMDNATQQSRSMRTSDRFSIIATYGKWSCVLLLCALVVYGSSAVVGYKSEYRNFLESFCYALLHINFLILVGMKVALHLCDSREEQESISARKYGSTPIEATYNDSQSEEGMEDLTWGLLALEWCLLDLFMLTIFIVDIQQA
ncbi:hypothetical protein HDU78_007979 [Chytriomyces hyalinus]|nr:hypothetical protein HDU78_007979 [Chytriomyces hyalinus]